MFKNIVEGVNLFYLTVAQEANSCWALEEVAVHTLMNAENWLHSQN